MTRYLLPSQIRQSDEDAGRIPSTNRNSKKARLSSKSLRTTIIQGFKRMSKQDADSCISRQTTIAQETEPRRKTQKNIKKKERTDGCSERNLERGTNADLKCPLQRLINCPQSKTREPRKLNKKVRTLESRTSNDI